jgi:exosortase
MRARLTLLCLLPSGLALSWLVWRAHWFWSRKPELQFGWIVLALCLFLLWEAWQKCPAARLCWSVAGAGLCATGLVMLFGAQIYQAAFGVTTEGMSALGLGVMLFIGGNLHYVFGVAGVKRFAFGLGFFFLALPVPDTIYYPLVAGLQSKVAVVNVELLNLAGIPAAQAGNAIRLPNCIVGIDEACSGIRSLQSAVMATLFIGYLTLYNRGLQIALFVAGLLFAIAGNLIRSFLLSWIANAQGVQAIESFHDAAGWSILLFTAGGVILSAWLLGKFEKSLARLAIEPDARTCDSTE